MSRGIEVTAEGRPNELLAVIDVGALAEHYPRADGSVGDEPNLTLLKLIHHIQQVTEKHGLPTSALHFAFVVHHSKLTKDYRLSTQKLDGSQHVIDIDALIGWFCSNFMPGVSTTNRECILYFHKTCFSTKIRIATNFTSAQTVLISNTPALLNSVGRANKNANCISISKQFTRPPETPTSIESVLRNRVAQLTTDHGLPATLIIDAANVIDIELYQSTGQFRLSVDALYALERLKKTYEHIPLIVYTDSTCETRIPRLAANTSELIRSFVKLRPVTYGGIKNLDAWQQQCDAVAMKAHANTHFIVIAPGTILYEQLLTANAANNGDHKISQLTVTNRSAISSDSYKVCDEMVRALDDSLIVMDESLTGSDTSLSSCASTDSGMTTSIHSDKSDRNVAFKDELTTECPIPTCVTATSVYLHDVTIFRQPAYATPRQSCLKRHFLASVEPK